jgi:hypothetical protein
MKKHTITIITILLALGYIILEAQSWVFLVQSLSSVTTAEEIHIREKFGYTTAAIGITLLFIQFGLKKLNERIKSPLVIAVLLSPLLYLISFVSVYSIVTNSTRVVDSESKPKALYAALYSMTNPEHSGLAPYYTLSNDDTPVSNQEIVNDFLKLYPSTKIDIAKAYNQGVNITEKIVDIYHYKLKPNKSKVAKGVYYMKKETYTTVQGKYVDAHFSSWNAERLINNGFLMMPYDIPEYIKNLLSTDLSVESHILQSAYLILLKRDALINTSTLSDVVGDPMLCAILAYLPSFCDTGYGSDKSFTGRMDAYPSPLVNSSKDNLSYLMWRFSMTRGEAVRYDLNQEQIDLYYQALTNTLLDPFGERNTPYIGLPKEMTFDSFVGSLAVKDAIMENAPFMISNEQYIVKLNRLNDKKYANRSRSFGRQYPDKAKVLWKEFQRDYIPQLLVSKSIWETAYAKKVYTGLLKQSVVLPVMLALSSILILLNVYVVSKAVVRRFAILPPITLLLGVVLYGVVDFAEKYNTALPEAVKDKVIYINTISLKI